MWCHGHVVDHIALAFFIFVHDGQQQRRRETHKIESLRPILPTTNKTFSRAASLFLVRKANSRKNLILRQLLSRDRNQMLRHSGYHVFNNTQPDSGDAADRSRTLTLRSPVVSKLPPPEQAALRYAKDTTAAAHTVRASSSGRDLSPPTRRHTTCYALSTHLLHPQNMSEIPGRETAKGRQV